MMYRGWKTTLTEKQIQKIQEESMETIEKIVNSPQQTGQEIIEVVKNKIYFYVCP